MTDYRDPNLKLIIGLRDVGAWWIVKAPTVEPPAVTIENSELIVGLGNDGTYKVFKDRYGRLGWSNVELPNPSGPLKLLRDEMKWEIVRHGFGTPNVKVQMQDSRDGRIQLYNWLVVNGDEIMISRDIRVPTIGIVSELASGDAAPLSYQFAFGIEHPADPVASSERPQKYVLTEELERFANVLGDLFKSAVLYGTAAVHRSEDGGYYVLDSARIKITEKD